MCPVCVPPYLKLWSPHWRPNSKILQLPLKLLEINLNLFLENSGHLKEFIRLHEEQSNLKK